jgi:hypothetical protein
MCYNHIQLTHLFMLLNKCAVSKSQEADRRWATYIYTREDGVGSRCRRAGRGGDGAVFAQEATKPAGEAVASRRRQALASKYHTKPSKR